MDFLKRGRYWLLFAVTLMVAVPSVTWTSRSGQLANFQKIKPGMTTREVEAIMGPTELYFPTGIGPAVWAWNEEPTLFTDEQSLQVEFDYQGKVTKSFRYPVEPSHFRRFVRRFGWHP